MLFSTLVLLLFDALLMECYISTHEMALLTDPHVFISKNIIDLYLNNLVGPDLLYNLFGLEISNLGSRRLG